MTYLVFGETSKLYPDTDYAYANSLSFDILNILGKDERFEDINQADLLNMALSVFMTCIMQYKHPKMALYFRQVLLDYDEFKEYIFLLMKDGRDENEQLLAKLEEWIETTDQDELEEVFDNNEGDD